jgi:hypothetical protein
VRGIGASRYLHGRFSKALPRNLAKDFHRALEDPELLSARSMAALLDSRLIQMLRQIEQAGPADLWRDLRKAWGKLESAHADGDAKLMQATLSKVGEIIKQGATDDQVWRSIRDIVRDIVRDRVSATTAEHRRLCDLHQVMTMDQAAVFARAMQDAVVSVVIDRQQLARIARRFAEVLNNLSGGQVISVSAPASPLAATSRAEAAAAAAPNN